MGETTPAKRSKTEIRMTAAERARKAMVLRAARVSYDNIARQLGYANRSSAFNAVKRELARIPREAAKELRLSELESLDNAERAIATLVASGNLQAIDRMLRIKDARAKLAGLYEEAPDTGVAEVKAVLAAWFTSITTEVDNDDDDEYPDDDEAEGEESDPSEEPQA